MIVDFSEGRHGALMHEGRPIAYLIEHQALGQRSAQKLLEAWQQIGQSNVTLSEVNVGRILSDTRRSLLFD